MTVFGTRQRLIERGVDLNEGRHADLGERGHDIISREIIAMHNVFDGFASMDEASLIQMWTLDRIENGGGYDFETKIPVGCRVIGDVLIGSDFIFAKMHDANEPLRLFYENKILCDSYQLFWEDLLTGKLDRR